MYSKFSSNVKLISFYKNMFSSPRLLKCGVETLINGSTSFPVTINMLITGKCNFNCNMCSWKAAENINNIYGKGELSLDDINRFIFQIRSYKPLVHLGGGEPFMRQDLYDILVTIKKNGLRCIVTTNGFLMDEKMIEKIIRLKLDGLIFSLYGWGDIHEEVTRVKGSFERTIKNLKSILNKRNRYPKTLVSTLPLFGNINAVQLLVRDLYRLGIDGIKIEQLNFVTPEEYKKSFNHKEFNLLPQTFIKEGQFRKQSIEDMIRIYRDLRKAYKNFVFIKPDLNDNQLMDWYTSVPRRKSRCFFMSHSVFINYNGDIIPCQFFPQCVLGNIKTDSIKDVWLSKNYKEIRETIEKIRPAACMRCCKN